MPLSAVQHGLEEYIVAKVQCGRLEQYTLLVEGRKSWSMALFGTAVFGDRGKPVPVGRDHTNAAMRQWATPKRGETALCRKGVR